MGPWRSRCTSKDVLLGELLVSRNNPRLLSEAPLPIKETKADAITVKPAKQGGRYFVAVTSFVYSFLPHLNFRLPQDSINLSHLSSRTTDFYTSGSLPYLNRHLGRLVKRQPFKWSPGITIYNRKI